MNLVLAGDMFGVVVFLGLGPARVELMYLDGDFAKVGEIICSPYLGETSFS
jgi:hypothetical protein